MVGAISFRDLTIFNDSLLAKQTWRLLHNIDYLFYRVFKVHLSPCSIMEAKELASSSYAWKSILKDRDVIQKGSFWRPGNGKLVKIWHHHWLPIKHPTKVISLVLETIEEVTVDCLINASTQ